jgi:hypothetical protein
MLGTNDQVWKGLSNQLFRFIRHDGSRRPQNRYDQTSSELKRSSIPKRWFELGIVRVIETPCHANRLRTTSAQPRIEDTEQTPTLQHRQAI